MSEPRITPGGCVDCGVGPQELCPPCRKAWAKMEAEKALDEIIADQRRREEEEWAEHIRQKELEVEAYLEQHCPRRRLRRAVEALEVAILKEVIEMVRRLRLFLERFGPRGRS